MTVSYANFILTKWAGYVQIANCQYILWGFKTEIGYCKRKTNTTTATGESTERTNMSDRYNFIH